MKKHCRINGFTLVEIIIVVTLIGIIGVPIVQSIMNAVKTNAVSKQKLDATILAQKVGESISIGGIGAETWSLVNTGDTRSGKMSVNNTDYFVSCEIKEKNTEIELGSDIPVLNQKYYQLEFNGSSIGVRRYINGVEDSTYSALSVLYSDFRASLVFKDNELQVHPYESLTSTPAKILRIPAQDIFPTDAGQQSRVIKIVNNRADNNILDLKIYNLYTNAPTTLSLYYDTNNVEKPNINLGKNVVLYNINGLSLNVKYMYKNTYKITIKKNESDAEALVTREVTRVSETQE